MGNSKIEWLDGGKTWNPITGCSHSGTPGCDHCYAKRMANRLAGRSGYPKDNPFKVTFHPDKLEQPLHWIKPCSIFVCSMGDIFHEDVRLDWIEDILNIIHDCSQHKFLILTKRPENIGLYLLGLKPGEPYVMRELGAHPDLLSNLWIGVSVENQAAAEKRLPALIEQTQGLFKLFVSCEPLLGPIELTSWIDKLSWVIVGGETGPGARKVEVDWILELSTECQKLKIPYFFKSKGSYKITTGYHQMLNANNAKRREFPKELAK